MENTATSSDFEPYGAPETLILPYSAAYSPTSDEEVFATIATSPPKRRTGRTKFRETRHPIYKGVRRRNGSKWVCEVREPNKKSRIWLGTFTTPEMAARAHDVAALALRGRSACLNFADSAWLLPIPASANAKDIQVAAAKAAEAFRPSKQQFLSGDDAGPTLSREDVFFLDEEADFGVGMPGLLASMAEGLLLSPPPLPCGSYWDDVEIDGDVPLWSHSI